MFRSKGLFKHIACPDENCELLNCFFNHDGNVAPEDGAMEIDQSSISEHPPAKRAKVTKESSSQAANTIPTPKPTPHFTSSTVVKKPGPPTPPPEEHEDTRALNKSTSKLTVSPPKAKAPSGTNANVATPSKPKSAPIKHSKEGLNPRMLVQPPDSHQKRRAMLLKLHENYNRLNEEVKKSTDPGVAGLELAPAQLVTLALDEEEKIAKESFQVYSNKIRARIAELMKMPLEVWKYHLLQSCLTSELDELKKRQSPAVKGERTLETNLTPSEERQIVTKLLIKQHGLEPYGYVTTPPSDAEISTAQTTLKAAKGWEKCNRCDCRFQVFPDRRLEDGAFTSGGKCIHHPGRLLANGRGQPNSYNCCQEAVGISRGCASAQCHVYKVENVARLASLLQYQVTPDNPAVGTAADGAYALDCEMGFTTMGFELIRMTVLSWPKATKVIDVLVRPYGAVLDLNTRFSGVSQQQFENAMPYNANSGPPDSELQIVGSPKEARDLLFQHINPDIPIIGHALDNDLSAMRVCHPCIVDTVVHCPHFAGLPVRRSLKSLARDYLHRSIQDAGIAGHDSSEDAKAAGDIVLELVKRKWTKMQGEGWKSDGGKLHPPKLEPRPQPVRRSHTDEKAAAAQVEADVMEEKRELEERKGRKRTQDDYMTDAAYGGGPDADGEDLIVLDYD